jgi:hypothetical protein
MAVISIMIIKNENARPEPRANTEYVTVTAILKSASVTPGRRERCANTNAAETVETLEHVLLTMSEGKFASVMKTT